MLFVFIGKDTMVEMKKQSCATRKILIALSRPQLEKHRDTFVINIRKTSKYVLDPNRKVVIGNKNVEVY